MTIQTNPEVFTRSLPIHNVTNVNRTAGIVTLSGSDGDNSLAKNLARNCQAQLLETMPPEDVKIVHP